MKRRNAHLTAGMERVLRLVKESEDGELVRASPGGWWVDDEEVPGNVCMRLLRLCLIHLEDFGKEDFERFTLNEDGEGVLSDAGYVPRILRAEAKERMGRTVVGKRGKLERRSRP